MKRIVSIPLSVIIGLCCSAIVGCDSEIEPEPEDTTLPGEGDFIHELPEGAVQIDLDTSNPQVMMAQLAVASMSSLAKEGNWEKLIDKYYGEADKIENDDQKQMLIDRFKNEWGEQLIPVLEKAIKIKPVIEGDKALFQSDGETIYELHLGEEGKWGFHL